MNRMQTFEFIFILIVAEKVLAKTNCLSEELQSSKIIISNAAELIEATSFELNTMKNDESFENVYAEAVKFASNLDVAEPNFSASSINASTSSNRPQRVRELSSKLKDYFVDSTELLQRTLPGTSQRKSDGEEPKAAIFKDDVMTSIYRPVINKVMDEFNARLVVHCPLFHSMASLNPVSSKFMDAQVIVDLASNYPTLFTPENIEDLKLQANMAKRLFSKNKDKVKSIHDVVKELQSLPAAFDELIKLVIVVATLPVSSSSSERFFFHPKTGKDVCSAHHGWRKAFESNGNLCRKSICKGHGL